MFRSVLKNSEDRSFLTCNQNIKEDIPTVLEVFLCFETKRKDINRSSTKTATQSEKYPGKNCMRTMSKNNLTRIALGIRPIWRIRVLTLIIS